MIQNIHIVSSLAMRLVDPNNHVTYPLVFLLIEKDVCLCVRDEDIIDQFQEMTNRQIQL